MIKNSGIDAALPLGPTSPTKPGTSTPRSAARQPGDHVEISGLAAQLSGDPSKVSRFQASFDAGTYRVSPQAVAGSLIQKAMMTSR